jgi:hypothetical protein
MTIQQDAKDYVDLLDSAPNGWGQHVHPQYGQSHNMLWIMHERHGKAQFDAAVDAEFAAAKEGRR